jgi:Recombination endonuclease VII
MEPKLCARCHQEPRASYGSYCKPCNSKRVCEWHLNNGPQQETPAQKRQRKSRNLERRYHITLEQFEDMWTHQQGLCKLCGNPMDLENRGSQLTVVDHDHDTGIVRGLLCFGCNIFVGYAQPRLHLFPATIDYLEQRAINTGTN